MELELIAFVASLIGSLAFVPQILKILKTQETAALSYQNYSMMFISSLVWILFGLTSSVYTMAVWNSIFALLSLTIIFLKFFNENHEFSLIKTIRRKG